MIVKTLRAAALAAALVASASSADAQAPATRPSVALKPGATSVSAAALKSNATFAPAATALKWKDASVVRWKAGRIRLDDDGPNDGGAPPGGAPPPPPPPPPPPDPKGPVFRPGTRINGP